MGTDSFGFFTTWIVVVTDDAEFLITEANCQLILAIYYYINSKLGWVLIISLHLLSWTTEIWSLYIGYMPKFLKLHGQFVQINTHKSLQFRSIKLNPDSRSCPPFFMICVRRQRFCKSSQCFCEAYKPQEGNSRVQTTCRIRPHALKRSLASSRRSTVHVQYCSFYTKFKARGWS